MSGPNEAALRAAIGGARPGALSNSATTWEKSITDLETASVSLGDGISGIDEGSMMGPGARAEALAAFKEMRGHIADQATVLQKTSLALGNAGHALDLACAFVDNLDTAYAVPDAPVAFTPDPTKTEAQNQTAREANGQDRKDHDTAAATREEQCGIALKKLNTAYQHADDTIREWHDLPVPPTDGGGGDPGNPTYPPGYVPRNPGKRPDPRDEPPFRPPIIKCPPGTPEPPVIIEPPVITEPPVCEPPPRQHPVPEGPDTDRFRDGYRAPEVTATTTVGGTTESGHRWYALDPDVATHHGQPGSTSSGGATGGGGASGAALAGAAAVAGGGLAAGAAGVARGGASGRLSAGAAGVIGGGRGSESSGGALGRAGAAAVAAGGAGGRGGRGGAEGRGGATAGVGGSGKAGGRSAAGSGAGGAGARGGRKDDDETAAYQAMESEQDWLDDESAGPGIID